MHLTGTVELSPVSPISCFTSLPSLPWRNLAATIEHLPVSEDRREGQTNRIVDSILDYLRFRVLVNSLDQNTPDAESKLSGRVIPNINIWYGSNASMPETPRRVGLCFRGRRNGKIGIMI